MKNKQITIKNDSGFSSDTEVFDVNGNEISNIKEIDVKLKVGEPVVANITMCMVSGDITANPILSLENIKYFAKQYGYTLLDNAQADNM